MKKKNVGQMLKAFRRDFELTLAEAAAIVKPNEISGFVKRVKRVDKIRREMEEIADNKSELHDLLFAYNNNLKMSYFEAMVKDRFDAVLEDLIEFNEDNFER